MSEIVINNDEKCSNMKDNAPNNYRAPEIPPEITYEKLIINTPFYQQLRKRLIRATMLSISGITNFVVNYEDPALINQFLEIAFPHLKRFNDTIFMDVTQIPNAVQYIDEVIFGSFKNEPGHPRARSFQTGEALRHADGFVSRREVTNCTTDAMPKDRTLINYFDEHSEKEINGTEFIKWFQD